MNRAEIRVTGFGGQGVVLMAYVVGRAWAVNAGKHSTMIQSFGPEARGSSCSATLVLSDEEILYPYIRQTDVFVVLSAEGYGKYSQELNEKGILVYESDLVPAERRGGQQAFGIPSTRIAEALGRTIVQNIVMLGFFTAATTLVTPEEMREALKGSVPAGTEELNLKAFDAGWDYFQKEYAGKEAASREGRADTGSAISSESRLSGGQSVAPSETPVCSLPSHK